MLHPCTEQYRQHPTHAARRRPKPRMHYLRRWSQKPDKLKESVYAHCWTTNSVTRDRDHLPLDPLNHPQTRLDRYLGSNPLVGAGVDRSDPVPGDRLSGSSRIRRKALIPVPLDPLVFRISWRMSELLLCGVAKDTRVV
jgi:hypothetical protein